MLGALLAWEFGGGRGHVVTLKTVAEAVSDRFTFDAALRDLTYKHELAGLCDAVQGPWLPFSSEYRKSRGNPGIATRGELLGDGGFCDPNMLRQSIGWWQEVMRECEISLLIADNAPCALLAARGLGIPSIAIGTGYLLPPPGMETFPILMPRHSTRIYDEAEMVDVLNSVLPEFGVPKLEWLPEIYACSDQLAFTLEMLDPYGDWRSEPLLPPIMGGTPEPAGDGDEIFVYFSGTEIAESELIEAIGRLDAPTRVFIPRLDEGTAQDFTRRGIHVERSPVPVDFVAQRSRLLVNAGQHGTLCMGVASGLPQVSAPQNLEQWYNAEAAQARAAVLPVDKGDCGAERFREIVLGAYEHAAMARKAKDLAEELRPTFQINQRKLIRRRIAHVMDERVQA